MKSYRRPILKTFALLAVFGIYSTGHAQLVVNGTTDIQALASSIAGNGVSISNAQITCAPNGFGYYDAINSNLGSPEGILLTTGNINIAVGPNNNEDGSANANTPGSSILTTVTNRTTYDACMLEFDIIPRGDTLSFDFVFASEEYNEWVGSQYNDVFGFFISGPGIAGDPGIGNDHNIALIPNTTTPIAINNVNANINPQFFFDNPAGGTVQYDGFTIGLKAISQVQPCETYHLKLAIADASDRMWDSGVFIEKIESNDVSMMGSTVGGMDQMIEGCNAGTITFTRQIATAQSEDVTFYLAGSATNGTDYPLIGVDPDPLVPKTITIPANQLSVDLVISPIADGTLEGPEEVKIYLGNDMCPGIYLDSLSIQIFDSLHTAVFPPSDTICLNRDLQLVALGGSSFLWSPPTFLDDPNAQNPIASPDSSITYTLTTTAGACTETIDVVIHVVELILSATISDASCNGLLDGSIDLNISSGIGPFLINWTGPNGFHSSDEDISGLEAGQYTVIVADQEGCNAIQSFQINEPSPIDLSMNASTLTFGQNISCNGGNDGSITLDISGGTAPYTILWSGPNGFTSNDDDINDLLAGTYIVVVNDQNNCVATDSITLFEPVPLVLSISDVDHVMCFGNSSGSAIVAVAGGVGPYAIVWNTVPVTNGTIASGLAAGTYTVDVTDAYGCTGQINVVITEPSQPLLAAIDSINNVLCYDDSTGTVHGSASGGSAPISYSWNTNPPTSGATLSGVPVGNYTLTVTDTNACTASASAFIDGPDEELVAYVQSQTNVACFGDSSGSASLFLSGGSGSYTIEWNTVPPQFGPSASGLPVGNYIATVTDNNGCTQAKLAALVITGPAEALSATTTTSIYGGGFEISCSGANDGSIDLTPTGGTMPYYFTWTSPDGSTTGTEDISGLDADTYTIDITDANGCSWTDSITLTEPTEILLTAITSPTTCQGTANGSIDLNISGGLPNYTIAWTGPNLFTSNIEDISSLEAGTYTALVTDSNGCSASLEVIVSQPGDLNITTVLSLYPGGQNLSCNDGSDGSIDVTVTGGSSPYIFDWSGPNAFTSNNEDISGLEAGDYIIQVTDDNGCTIDQLITLSEPTPVVVDLQALSFIGGFNVSCASSSDGQIDATITGGVPGYNVSWTGPNGYTASNEDIFGLEAGTYYIDILDQNNCVAQDSITLLAPDTLNASAFSPILNGGYNISCSGGNDGSIDLTISGGNGPFTFAWVGPNGFNAVDEDLSGLEAGIYGVTITDENGCTTSANIMLTEAPPIVLSSTNPTVFGGWNISCNGGSDGSIDLSIAGGIPSYSTIWSGPNGFNSNDEDITGLKAGTYTVLVTDSNGCINSLSIDLTEPDPLSAEFVVSTFVGGANISCLGANDGSIELNTSGGTINYTHIWNGPNLFYSTDHDISGLEPGTYYVDISDANGCTLSDSVTLLAPDSLSFDLNALLMASGYNTSCAGAADGQIDLEIISGNAAFSFGWTGPNGFTSTEEDISGIIAGTYYVTVTDTNNCIANDSITLTEPTPIDISAIATTFPGGNNVSCAGANDGSIDLSISGGSQPYQFNWTGPAGSYTTEDLSGIPAGTYDLLVTDTSGCTAQLSIVLTDPIALSTTITSSVFPGGANISCFGMSDGSVDLSVFGGSPPFTFDWSGPNGFTSNNEDISGLAAGSYTVIATDTNGCTVLGTIDLTQPDSLAVALYSPLFAGGFNIACAGDTSGVLEVTATGGTAGFSYSWTGPNGFSSSDADIIGLLAGAYSITVVDTNGCAATDTLTLTQPADTLSGILDALVQLSGNNISCHGGSDGAIDASILGGVPAYMFDWRGPNNYSSSNEDISGLSAGEYELVVIDTNECPLTLLITLTEPDTSIYISPVLSQYPGNVNVRCDGAQDGSIELFVNGGSPEYDISWTGPNGFSSNDINIDSLFAGTYLVQVVDTNNCVFNDSIVLIAPEPLLPVLSPFVFPGGTNISCYGMNDGSISAGITGGTAAFDHSWSGPIGYSSNNLNIGDLIQGNYCLTVIDTNACEATMCVVLIEPDALMLNAQSDTAMCGDPTGGIDLSVSGGSGPFNFDWSGMSNNEDLLNVSAGNYTVHVTDANGCADSLSTEVFGIDGVDGSATINDVLCNGDNSGSIDLSLSSGTAPFTFNWSNNEQTEDIGGLYAGSYSISVVDSNGCEMVQNYEIMQNDPFDVDTVLSAFNGYNISTFQGSDGTIELQIGGATAPYSYLWNTGDTTATVSGLPAGTYTVTITDANGCERIMIIELTEPLDLIMPTGFSPNGDGANDAFMVQGLDAYPDNQFKVVNRWGNTVYETNNYRNDWRGENMSGAALADGTYFVLLSINGGMRSITGYVDLRR